MLVINFFCISACNQCYICGYLCQVTWLDGYSLAQTVFTNIYLHEPSLIEDRYLRAFSFAVLKIVDIIRERLVKAAVFEEVTYLVCIIKINFVFAVQIYILYLKK